MGGVPGRAAFPACARVKGLLPACFAFCSVLVLSLFGSPLFAPAAQAQFAWMGAGSTPQGDYMRGVGVALYGAGYYNLNTARANQINVQTEIFLNEYISATLKQENADNARYRAMVRERHEENWQKIQRRIREAPEESDLFRGDALNAKREDLMSPQNSSALRFSPLPLPGDTVRRIPFFYGPADATISIQRLSTKGKWPIGLRGAKFARERAAYEHAVDNAMDHLNEGKGKLQREHIKIIEAAIQDLLQKLDREVPSAGNGDRIYNEAKNTLRQMKLTVELFKSHNVEQILYEIERYSGTTVVDLLQFMQRNNLKFGVAEEIGDERDLYRELFQILDEQKAQQQVGAPPAAAPPVPGTGR